MRKPAPTHTLDVRLSIHHLLASCCTRRQGQWWKVEPLRPWQGVLDFRAFPSTRAKRDYEPGYHGSSTSVNLCAWWLFKYANGRTDDVVWSPTHRHIT
jgi:hypothetical protein